MQKPNFTNPSVKQNPAKPRPKEHKTPPVKTSTGRMATHNNETRRYKIIECGKTLNKTEYDVESLYDILEYLQDCEIFRKLSVPIYMYQADIREDETLKGTRQIGYLRSYDKDTRDVAVTIFSNASYMSKIAKFKNPMLYCRCTVHDRMVGTVLELVLCDYSRYEHLMPNRY